MKPRPLSISIVGWVMIVTGFLTVLANVWAMGRPEMLAKLEKTSLPAAGHFLLSFWGLGIRILCGVGLLRGQGWARRLYVGWGAVGLLFSLFLWHQQPLQMLLMIPQVIFYAVTVFFLFRPKANAFLAGKDAPLQA